MKGGMSLRVRGVESVESPWQAMGFCAPFHLSLLREDKESP